MYTHRHPLPNLPGPCIWHGPLITLLVQVGQFRVIDQFLCHVGDLGEPFARQQSCLVQALRCQSDGIGNVGAWVAFAVLVWVLHYVGELGPDVLVCEEGAEEILGVE